MSDAELQRRLEAAAICWDRQNPEARTDATDPLIQAIPRDMVPSAEVMAEVKAITGKSPDAAGVQYFNSASTRAAWCRAMLKRWAVG